MKCPYCKSIESQVLESRIVEDGKAFRRRRQCAKCTKRFTTFERVVKTTLWVVKKDGKREPFERQKIVKGISRAIRKRPVSVDLVEEIADKVELEVLKSGKSEINSSMIGKSILGKLKKIDKVAWLRFASVYLEFENLDDFEEAIERGNQKGK